ncbi:hypothetical protein MHSWG343_03310 [Candidatus Mycoplasma haematohominis]|uniref:Uncharacterized protein n=1 Tax=Candidatus Mycoplasma haematohominis TaxID=1494318 RepID=A0A478FPZ5_9MOLU|nr:hypothetical protein MHSWG343_03310 [Candidatus Mycoplasma haemohominis]
MSGLTFRKHHKSLQEWESLKPLTKRLRRTVRGWWMTILYLWGMTIGLLVCAKKFEGQITWIAIAFILHVIIVLVIYFKNNKRNMLLYTTLQEYSNIQKLDALGESYRTLVVFTRIIIVLDAFLWPVIFPIKFVFWIMYRMFTLRIWQVKKMIIKGSLELIPDEEEIAADPFYSFLIREGLYEDSLAMGKFNSFEEELEENLAPVKKTEDVEEKKEETNDEKKTEVKEEEKEATNNNEQQKKKW